MSLRIRTPRKVQLSVADKWAIVKRCNGSRRAMVNFICGIGGYYGHGRDQYAIAFNVKAYGTNLGADYLWALVMSDRIDVGPDKDTKAEHMAVIRSLFDKEHKANEEHLWTWGQEEAYEGWADSDTPYETFTGERVEWKWAVDGRGGGYICMTECEGIDLRMTADDLEELLMDRGRDDDGRWAHYTISDDQLRKLFIICVQNSVELTQTEAAKEVEYRAAWRLWVTFIEDQIPAAIQAYETRERLTEDAQDIMDHLIGGGGDLGSAEAFQAICFLAGIQLKDN